MSDLSWLDRLAHDLRGPLAPLQTAAQLLSLPDLPATQRDELAAIIVRQTEALTGMIQELADWISLLRGNPIGARVPCDLGYLLATARSSLDADSRALVVIHAPDAPLEMHADAHRLVQAFATLIRLRLRLGDGQPLALTLQPAGAEACIAFGEGIVFGEGIGATAAIAQALERALVAPSPESGGLGLSVPIAVAMVAAHGGRVQWQGDAHQRRLLCHLPLTRAND